jgi:hypothetical protein
MAIVKYGTSVVGIRKTLGGITFSHTNAGPIARAWTPSVMAFTPRQTAQQAIMASLTPPWNALDPALKELWRLLGLTPPETDVNSLGLTYFLSGFQWYQRVNTRNALAGRPRLDSPPSGGPVSPPTGVSITAAAGPPAAVTLLFDALPFIAAPYAVPYLNYSSFSGRSRAHSAFYAAPIADAHGNTSLDCTSFVTDRWGPPRANDTLFARLRCQTNSGLRSVFVATYTVIA